MMVARMVDYVPEYAVDAWDDGKLRISPELREWLEKLQARVAELEKIQAGSSTVERRAPNPKI